MHPQRELHSNSTYFLVPKRTRQCSESMNGSDKVSEKVDNTSLQKPARIELFPMGTINEIPISSNGPKGCNALFLQDAERKAAYFGEFQPGYFMHIGPGSENNWNFEKYPDNVKGKWINWPNMLRMCIVYSSNHP